MGAIADLFRAHADEYLQRFGDRMPAGHRKVIDAICACRTKQAGVNHYRCEKCSEVHRVFRGCGNRHCPNCQHAKCLEWLRKRLEHQLPGPHFMITFTVPEQLRSFFRSHQAVAYSALFKSSSEALKALIADEKYVGGDLPGFFGVLHTWGRQLSYHPHIHYISPGGALDRKDKLWKPSQENFLVPVKALSKLVCGKFKAAMKEADLLDPIDESAWQEKWVVDSQAIGPSTEGALKYLAPYVFRVAISDSRILAVTDQTVTFRYNDTQTGKNKTTTLNVFEFMRRFLQHVLPKGFQKIRYYGFMGSGCKVPHEEINLMIELCLNFECKTPQALPEPEKKLRCPSCGGRLVLFAVMLGNGVFVQMSGGNTT